MRMRCGCVMRQKRASIRFWGDRLCGQRGRAEWRTHPLIHYQRACEGMRLRAIKGAGAMRPSIPGMLRVQPRATKQWWAWLGHFFTVWARIRVRTLSGTPRSRATEGTGRPDSRGEDRPISITYTTSPSHIFSLLHTDTLFGGTSFRSVASPGARYPFL